jgi:hypothetical protein
MQLMLYPVALHFWNVINCGYCKEYVGRHKIRYNEPDKMFKLVIKNIVFNERMCRNDEVVG